MRDGTRTRDRIELEALRLFAERGVGATSIRDIAGAAGVSEGAIYRHTKSKEALARRLFDGAYAALAAEVLRAGATGPFADIVPAVIGVFCRLFDEDRPLFTFLLLTQHDYLREIPADLDRNVVEAVKSLFDAAMARGEIPAGNAEELTAMALGVVAQPAVFTIYGRLKGRLSGRVGAMSAAVLALAGER